MLKGERWRAAPAFYSLHLHFIAYGLRTTHSHLTEDVLLDIVLDAIGEIVPSKAISQ